VDIFEIPYRIATRSARETTLIDRSHNRIILRTIRLGRDVDQLTERSRAKSGTPDGISRDLILNLNPTKSNTGYIVRAHSNLLLNLTLCYPFPETCFGPNPLYAFFRFFSPAARLPSFNPSNRVPTTLKPVSAPLITNVYLISVRLRSVSSTARHKIPVVAGISKFCPLGLC